MTLFLTFITGITGLVVGRFLKICIYRIPRKMRIVIRDAGVPGSYPLIEALNALGWLMIIQYFGFTARGIAGTFLFSMSLMITMIDLEHYIIPDSIVLTTLIGGIVYHSVASGPGPANLLLGLAVGLAVPFFLAVISKGGLGGGDIKLSAVMGFWLGFPGVFYALFLGALSGSIAGILLMILKIKKRKDPIPFGPFLTLGFLSIFFCAM